MKNLWMDLELRNDIDDFIVLMYVIENKNRLNINLTDVSIHNPTENELLLLLSLKNLHKLNYNIIYNGKIEVKNDEDINSVCNKYIDKKLIFNECIKNCINFENYNVDSFKNKIFFGGGSLNTFSKIIDYVTNENFFIQGGFVGKNIIPKEKSLKKFATREWCPSWNLNLDENATKKIISNKNNNFSFISKNICHDSIIELNDLKNTKKNYVNDILKEYLSEHHDKKAMHDVLAFFAIIDTKIIKFKSGYIEYKEEFGKYTQYRSVLGDSNIKLSISFDKELFKNKLLNIEEKIKEIKEI